MGIVFAGQRTQFDRHQDRHLVGRAPQIVVEPRDSCGAGHTAQSEDRDAPYVGPQAESPGDARVQGRDHGARDRGGDDQIDVLGAQPRLVERAGQRGAAQFGRMLDEQAVALTEIVEIGVFLERPDQIPAVHFRTLVQGPHHILDLGVSRQIEQGAGDLVLRIPMRRQYGMDAGNGAVAGHSRDVNSHTRTTGAYPRRFNAPSVNPDQPR